MPKFFYIVRNQEGEKETGVEDALSQEELISRLQSKGLIVVSVVPESSDVPRPGATKFKVKAKHSRVTSYDLTLFCRQISTLLGAGITILKSLDIIRQQVASKKLAGVIDEVKKNMEAGLSFHEALAKHPDVFSEMWINLVESGEASGSLVVVLSRLAAYLERNEAFKKKIISALIYPAILLMVGFGAFLFVTLKIIPTFAEIFAQFNVELPLLTQILISFSSFVRTKFILVVVLIVSVGYAFKVYVQTKNGRLRFEQLQLSIPVFGEFFHALAIERFSSGMSTLLESGVPILYSLEISERSAGNMVLSNIISSIKENVRSGKTLGQPFEESGFFDPMVVQMVSIGEEIGELPQMFKRINAFYQEYVESFLGRIISMFEPMMLILMGALIGTMLIGVFMPIFQVANLQ